MSDILDQLATIESFDRIRFPYIEGEPAPNDWTNLVDIGIFEPLPIWEENDAHFRVRLKEKIGVSND